MDLLWMKQIEKSDFVCPAKFLVDVQPQLVSRGQKSIKDDQLIVEKLCAAFLACGLNLIWGEDYRIDIISEFDDGGTDIDWILRSSSHSEVEYIPVQVKTHFNEFWSPSPMGESEYHQFLENQIKELSKYKNSQEVIFTVHTNKSVELDIRKLIALSSEHDFRGLFITGRGSADGSIYNISGDYLKPHDTFVCERYSLEAQGRIIPC